MDRTWILQDIEKRYLKGGDIEDWCFIDSGISMPDT
jgi:hypothetical protein